MYNSTYNEEKLYDPYHPERGVQFGVLARPPATATPAMPAADTTNRCMTRSPFPSLFPGWLVARWFCGPRRRLWIPSARSLVPVSGRRAGSGRLQPEGRHFEPTTNPGEAKSGCAGRIEFVAWGGVGWRNHPFIGRTLLPQKDDRPVPKDRPVVIYRMEARESRIRLTCACDGRRCPRGREGPGHPEPERRSRCRSC